MNNITKRLALLYKKPASIRISSQIGSLINRLLRLPGLGPLTTRGIVTVLGSLYLLLGPIQGSADIVSASLVSALLALLCLATIAVKAWGFVLQRTLSVTVTPPDQLVTSDDNVRLVLSLSSTPIPPLTALDISLVFEHSGALPSVIRVSGFQRTHRIVSLDLSFPHRGPWDITAVRCCYKDMTGLVRHAWEIPQQTGIVVSPPTVYESMLPVLSSTQRPGEMIVDIFNRQGDPFDIKAYHPTDGVHRIVWKAFAKRGELLSRHPEASMTPEGFVIMMVVAQRKDDKACAHALAYSETLSKLNLEIIGSCLGAHNRPPAHSTSTFQELLIDSVWGAGTTETLTTDTTALLDYCGQFTPGISVSKLILFTSSEFVSNEDHRADLLKLAAWLQEQNITPVFCLSPAERVFEQRKDSKLSRLLVKPKDKGPNKSSAAAFNSFLTECLRHQWEVHV